MGSSSRSSSYKYEERGGTRVSSRELGVDEHIVVKTLVMETDASEPLIVLMHGDCEVSTKQLARILSVKSVSPCDPKVANRHSGYLVGGTSPFGTKRPMPVYCEAGILGPGPDLYQRRRPGASRSHQPPGFVQGPGRCPGSRRDFPLILPQSTSTSSRSKVRSSPASGWLASSVMLSSETSATATSNGSSLG